VSLKDTILGLLNRTDIINFLVILGKLCIWECRKAGIFADFNIFLKKVKSSLKPRNIWQTKMGLLQVSGKDGKQFLLNFCRY